MTNSDNKKVLFLGLSGIGNLIMQVPAIRELKKAHPHWHITLWVAPRGTKAIATPESAIDEIIEMPIQGSISEHFKRIMDLRRRNFDIAIVLSPGQLMKSALYLFLAGIPRRIGNTYPWRNNKHSKLFLTDGINEDPSLHDIEQNLLLLEPLGITQTHVPYYSLEVPQENAQEAQKLVPTKSSFTLGIHLGSAPGFEWKRWPLDRFAEVATAVIQKHPDARILVFGGKDEEIQKQELVDTINKDLQVAFNISASLLTTAAIMKQCTIFLSNDSGLMHIAAATGIPAIGLFGPTSEIQTGPRGKNSVVVRAPNTVAVYNTEHSYSFGNTSHKSMEAITTKMVVDKIELMSINSIGS